MKNSEYNKFRKVLEAAVIELDHSTRRRDAILVEGGADEIDRMVGANARELAVRNLETISAKQRQTRSALRRIQEGTYGICLECDEPISPKRLAALPSAALCIRCQEASDCRCGAKNGRPVLPLAA